VVQVVEGLPCECEALSSNPRVGGEGGGGVGGKGPMTQALYAHMNNKGKKKKFKPQYSKKKGTRV
jgi:hypothetical protein